MIRTSITPEQTDIHLSVPQKYVGRKLEVLLYPVDEITDEADKESSLKKPSDFAGTISKHDAKKLHEHLKKSREEWDRDF